MTKRVFEAIAQRITNLFEDNAREPWEQGYNVGLRDAARAFADVAESENPRFDRVRFLTACGF